MNDFIRQHEKSVLGQLNGIDRVRFRGALRFVVNAEGLGIFLHRWGSGSRSSRSYAMGVTDRIKAASLAAADAWARPHLYLPSASRTRRRWRGRSAANSACFGPTA